MEETLQAKQPKYCEILHQYSPLPCFAYFLFFQFFTTIRYYYHKFKYVGQTKSLFQRELVGYYLTLDYQDDIHRKIHSSERRND